MAETLALSHTGAFSERKQKTGGLRVTGERQPFGAKLEGIGWERNFWSLGDRESHLSTIEVVARNLIDNGQFDVYIEKLRKKALGDWSNEKIGVGWEPSDSACFRGEKMGSLGDRT